MKKGQETDGKTNCRSINRFREAYEAACSGVARVGKATKDYMVDGSLKNIVVSVANARTYLDIDQNEAKSKMECCFIFSEYLKVCSCIGFDMEHMVEPDGLNGLDDDLLKRVFRDAESRVKRLLGLFESQFEVFYRIALDLMSESLRIHEEIIWLGKPVENVYTLTDRLFDFLAYMFGNVEDFVSVFDKWGEVYGPSQT